MAFLVIFENMRLLFFTLIVFVFNSCEVSEYLEIQKSFLKDIKVSNSDKAINLIGNLEFNQSRGVIETDYSCYLQSGEQKLLWESNTMEFYLSNPNVINCEYNEIGGIAHLKLEDKYYVWIYPNGFTSNEKIIVKLKSNKFVSKFNNLSSIKPFIYTNYVVSNKNIKIRIEK